MARPNRHLQERRPPRAETAEAAQLAPLVPAPARRDCAKTGSCRVICRRGAATRAAARVGPDARGTLVFDMAIEHRMGALLLLFVAACSRPDAARGGDASNDSASAVLASAAAPASAAPAADPNAPLVELSRASTCSASHSCSLSHPGLGSSGRGTAVDLATCTRTTWSWSGPWKAASHSPPVEHPIEDLHPVASGRASATPPPKPAPTPIAPAECEHLKMLVASVTAKDVTEAREPAKMDTAACGLTVECGMPRASAINVQRQTTSGSGHVVELIRAVYGVP